MYCGKERDGRYGNHLNHMLDLCGIFIDEKYRTSHFSLIEMFSILLQEKRQKLGRDKTECNLAFSLLIYTVRLSF